MTPGGSVAPSVAPELMPVIVLEDNPPELQWLKSQGLYCRTAAVAAGGAGTRSSVTILNPSTTSLVAVVEAFQVVVASGLVLAKLVSYPGIIPFGTNQTGLPLDGRNTGRSTTQIITDNTLGVAGGSNQLTLASAEWNTTPFILTPGSALYLSPNADNVAITYFNVRLRERSLNRSERL